VSTTELQEEIEQPKRAVPKVDGVLLVHPVIGLMKPGDVDPYTHMRTYKALAAYYYDPDRILLALFLLAVRLVGRCEALWHALILRNYGVDYLMVGRDHAGPGLAQPDTALYRVSHTAEENVRPLA
jgi:sulfate adenylyltransferase